MLQCLISVFGWPWGLYMSLGKYLFFLHLFMSRAIATETTAVPHGHQREQLQRPSRDSFYYGFFFGYSFKILVQLFKLYYWGFLRGQEVYLKWCEGNCTSPPHRVQSICGLSPSAEGHSRAGIRVKVSTNQNPDLKNQTVFCLSDPVVLVSWPLSHFHLQSDAAPADCLP